MVVVLDKEEADGLFVWAWALKSAIHEVNHTHTHTLHNPKVDCKVTGRTKHCLVCLEPKIHQIGVIEVTL